MIDRKRKSIENPTTERMMKTKKKKYAQFNRTGNKIARKTIRQRKIKNELLNRRKKMHCEISQKFLSTLNFKCDVLKHPHS